VTCPKVKKKILQRPPFTSRETKIRDKSTIMRKVKKIILFVCSRYANASAYFPLVAENNKEKQQEERIKFMTKLTVNKLYLYTWKYIL